MAKSKTLKRVLIMAGGTGGHVFPGLSVAQSFKNNDIDVHWLGTHHGLEAKFVPEAGLPLHYVSIAGLRRSGIKPLLLAPFTISKAIYESMRIIRKINPDLILGMGGFVSGPGGVASWLRRVPLVIHEQNAKAGFTNQMLAHFARKVLEGFPNSFQANNKVITVGNPVRSEIENLPPPIDRSQSKDLRLLILGGSRGAAALNEIVPNVLAKLTPNERPLILHQTGELSFEKTKAAYKEKNIIVEGVVPFIKDMAQAYQWADMVLCRSGALTVAELCTAGLGAIFIPFPYAVDDHQTANANHMVRKNAAICIQQKELSEDKLIDVIKQFRQSPDKRLAMAQAAYDLRQINVADKIVGICKEVCS